MLAVVSLNDTEELSSEEDSEEEEEDSGSEVEIIEEVKGNGMQQQLYLQDLQPEDQFLQEQAAAVLSLVTDPQLKVSSHPTESETHLQLKLTVSVNSFSIVYSSFFI